MKFKDAVLYEVRSQKSDKKQILSDMTLMKLIVDGKIENATIVNKQGAKPYIRLTQHNEIDWSAGSIMGWVALRQNQSEAMKAIRWGCMSKQQRQDVVRSLLRGSTSKKTVKQ